MDANLIHLIGRVEQLEQALAGAGIGDPKAMIDTVLSALDGRGVRPFPNLERDLATLIGRVSVLEQLSNQVRSLNENVTSLAQSVQTYAGREHTTQQLFDQRIGALQKDVDALTGRLASLFGPGGPLASGAAAPAAEAETVKPAGDDQAGSE